MPDLYMLVAAAILGAIGGSFLNALSFRMGTGKSVMRGRSQCMRCGHVLGVPDLIPVLSWLFLKGRCRYCHTPISWQYPLVEAAAAALAAGVAYHTADPLLFALGFIFWLTALFVVVYDLRHFIIPWSSSILLALVAAVQLVLLHGGLWAWVAGPLLAAPLVLISLISRGRWMGWGDGALELSLGLWLGLSMGATAFLLAFWSGAAVGIGVLLLRRGYTMKSELPFAPFLILGAGVAYFFHVDLFSTLSAIF